jgi:formate hydrogenlyase subunit 3/multisubunit Na+/H+ antiporter MnhD subunit
MDMLIEEFAKILNVTVEKAIELFPILKGQFLKYAILTEIESPLRLILIASMIVLTVAGIVSMVYVQYNNTKDKFWEEEVRVYKLASKVVKISLIIIVILLILLTIISISKYTLAPDFMMLKQFILK